MNPRRLYLHVRSHPRPSHQQRDRHRLVVIPFFRRVPFHPSPYSHPPPPHPPSLSPSRFSVRQKRLTPCRSARAVSLACPATGVPLLRLSLTPPCRAPFAITPRSPSPCAMRGPLLPLSLLRAPAPRRSPPRRISCPRPLHHPSRAAPRACNAAPCVAASCAVQQSLQRPPRGGVRAQRWRLSPRHAPPVAEAEHSTPRQLRS